MAIFPGAIATDSDLYIAVNNQSTLLTDNPLTIGATTVNVISTTGFPAVGFISIDAEIIKYTGITATSFTGCTRGADGTTAASHLLNAQVDHNVIAAHHNAPKDEIIAIETMLNAKLGTSSAPYTSGRVAVTSGGIIVVSGTTTTELDYLQGVTSAIQTQLNSKATDTLVVHLAGTETITGQKTFSSAVLIADGTVSLPGLALSSDPDCGLYKFDTNVPAIAANGISSVRFYQYGISVGPSATTLGAGFVADFRDDTASQTVSIRVLNNENTSGTSNARISIVTNSTGGDPYLYLTDQDTFGWGIGQDNSDSDKLFIYRGSSTSPDSPSTGTAVMTFDTSARVAIGTKNPGSYNSNADDFVIANSAGVVGMTLRSGTNSSCVLGFTDAEGTTVQGLIQYNHNATATAETMIFRVGGTDVGEIIGGGIRHVQTSGFSLSDGTNNFTVGTVELTAMLIMKGYALLHVSGQFTTGGTVSGSQLHVSGIATMASNYALVNGGVITGYGHGLVTTNSGTDPRALLSPTITSAVAIRTQRANGAAWSASTVYNFHFTVFAQIA